MNTSPDSSLLKNRTILVTGASEGIGREAAITYAKQGARVILTGRHLEKRALVSQTIDDLLQQPACVLRLDLATATAEDYQ